MAKRFNQLTQLTAAQVAQNDILAIRDESAGQTKYITVKDLTGSPDTGWVATGEAWTFSSFNTTSRIGVVTVPTDATTKYAVGMFVRFTQTTGGTKYGRILSITATTLTIWFDSTYTLNNETLTSPVYSPLAHPVGLPVTISEGQPYRFSATKSSASNYTPTGIIQPFATELFDGADVYSTATNRFTAPVNGYYWLNVNVQVLEPTAGNVDCNIQLRKNGTLIKKGGNIKGVAYPQTPCFTLVYLAAGDYVEVFGTNVLATIPTETNTTSGYFEGSLSSR